MLRNSTIAWIPLAVALVVAGSVAIVKWLGTASPLATP